MNLFGPMLTWFLSERPVLKLSVDDAAFSGLTEHLSDTTPWRAAPPSSDEPFLCFVATSAAGNDQPPHLDELVGRDELVP